MSAIAPNGIGSFAWLMVPSAEKIRMRTTRQAGADQLFGSYPSRADVLRLSKVHDTDLIFRRSWHVDVLRDPVGRGHQGGVYFVDVAFRYARAGMSDQGFDGRDRKA